MNDRQVTCFLWTATYENLHRAAEHLNMSQPTVSYQIKTLEDEVGFRLFSKQGRGIALTEGGRSLYHDLLRIRTEVDEAVERARELSVSPDNTLVVAWPATICDRDIITAAVGAFRDACPEVAVDVVAIDRVDSLMRVGNRTVDVAVTLVEDRSEDDLVYVELCAMASSCKVGVSHPLASRKSVTLGDLAAQVIYMVPPGRYLSRYDKMLERLRSHKPALDVRFVESQSDVEVNVACGGGVSIHPVAQARLHVARNGSVAIPLDPINCTHLALAYEAENQLAAQFCTCAANRLRTLLA